MDINAVILNQLDRKSKVDILAELIGYAATPPDVHTILHDPYYLGNTHGTDPDSGRERVYPIWQERLKIINPDPITTNSFVIFKGCIGSGKSTASKTQLLIDIIKIIHMKNPGSYFELMDKPLKFVIYNIRKFKAQAMIEDVLSWMEKSPFFQEERRNPNSIIHKMQLAPAGRIDDIISDDVVSVVLSELNFVRDYEMGTDLINATISRIESRFQKGFGLFNHVILDSSDTDVDSPVETFIKEHPKSRETMVFSTAIWEAKPELYFQEPDDFGSTSFKVYAGDSEIEPYIIKDGEDLSRLDPDRIIDRVPNELKSQFEADIYLALIEKAGIALISNAQFFSPQLAIPAFNITPSYKPSVVVDFFDDTDLLIHLLEQAISELPLDRYIFGRLDLGVVHDRAGFAIGYVQEYKEKRLNDLVVSDAKFKVPIAIGISRIPGQETAISKIRDLILSIHAIRPFKNFTTDTYQSTQLRQDLNKVGLLSFPLSVDRTDVPYKLLKTLVYQRRVDLPNNPILRAEILNLKLVGNKVDHPNALDANGTPGSNSKDIADAVAGLVQTMYEAGDEAMDVPVGGTKMGSDYSEMINEWYLNEQKKRAIAIGTMGFGMGM